MRLLFSQLLATFGYIYYTVNFLGTAVARLYFIEILEGLVEVIDCI